MKDARKTKPRTPVLRTMESTVHSKGKISITIYNHQGSVPHSVTCTESGEKKENACLNFDRKDREETTKNSIMRIQSGLTFRDGLSI